MLAALLAAAPASAAEVLVLGKDGRVHARADRVPARAALPAPPPRAAVATAARRRERRRGVVRELRRLFRDGDRAYYELYRAAWRDAHRGARRLEGTPRAEMRGVLRIVKGIAARGDLTLSRLPVLWLTLRRNLEWWTEGTVPASGQRVEFEGSELLWQYFPGQGLALHPLGNFGKLNALWRSHDDAEASQLMDELLALAVERAGGVAWEYYFAYGGGEPPWVSGMAQGTGLQSMARVASRLGREAEVFPVLQRALAIFETPTPEGVRVPEEGGDHYALYSYAPDFRVINGFAQALVGLFDYAAISGDPRGHALFEAGDRRARAALPAFDTGAWSLYSRGSLTRESDLSYHDLLRGFVRNLCRRTRADVYCATARRFRQYKHEPPVIDVRPRRLRGGRYGRVRFELSKISSVDLTITRGDRVVEARPFGNVGYGERSFGWEVPRRRGRYTVELRATDLAGNSASATATVRVLRPKRKRRP